MLFPFWHKPVGRSDADADSGVGSGTPTRRALREEEHSAVPARSAPRARREQSGRSKLDGRFAWEASSAEVVVSAAVVFLLRGGSSQ